MRVIDCILFAGEFEALELRMQTLTDVVTHTVIVEGTETFSGKPKPLYLRETLWGPGLSESQHHVHRSLHGRRLVYSIIDGWESPNPWQREYQQRNTIAEALQVVDDEGASLDDLILISDVDEIPNPFAVALIAQIEREQRTNRVYAFKQALYSFTVNWRFDRDWYGTRAVRFEHLGEPQRLRSTLAPQPGEMVVAEGGWSYTWMGGIDAVRTKAQSFAHTEVDRPEYLIDENIRRAITEGRSLVAGDGNSYHWEDFGEQHPPYLRESRERFPGWFHEDWVG